VAVRVDELVPSAGSEVGSVVSVIDATSADEPIVTFVACVTLPDSQIMSAIPVMFKSDISDTITLPGSESTLVVVTVMICFPFEKRPRFVVNVTGTLSLFKGLPDTSSTVAVIVDELYPSAEIDPGFAASVIAAIGNEPMLTDAD
jgi:hypothetical protein